MHTFTCRSAECGRSSDIKTILWHDNKHIVECEHCNGWHELAQLPSADGESIQFQVVGLLDP